MFKLVNGLVVLVLLAALAYVAFFVPFGQKTLWEHLAGISKTDEAEELKHEVKKKVAQTVDQISDEVIPRANQVKDKITAQTDEIDDEDREALDKLIEEKTGSGTGDEDRGPSDDERAALKKLISEKNR